MDSDASAGVYHVGIKNSFKNLKFEDHDVVSRECCVS